MTNIILCGGSGTRLWPLSRTLMPKQFVKLFHDRSLFQETLLRNQKVCTSQLIVSNAEQYFLVLDQIEELATEQLSTDHYQSRYLLEPIGRNTAPAIALACFALEPEEIVLVTPSDHLIEDEESYLEAIRQASSLAEQNYLVTFGITPQYPETGFGYIEADGNDVRAFKEKPDLTTAQRYLEAGNYYWNSGMFCFKAGLFLQELNRYAPDIYATSHTAYTEAKYDEMIRIHHKDMVAIPEESIDYAVMEKSDRVKVIPSDIGWSDLGSFDALYEALPKDKDHNALKSTDSTMPMIQNAKNNLIISEKQVALIDVDNLLIVDTADALLISQKGKSQKVKEVVNQLKARHSELPNIHVTAHRPWGTYTILDESKGYKVKRIVVKPGKRLSLQKHHHRSEHWIVVSGTALVTRGEKTYTINANESTYIPIGEVHRLENVGKIPLIMIEAQVGEYVGEDDIVRLEDDFKRMEKR